jgi:hypothetical protein
LRDLKRGGTVERSREPERALEAPTELPQFLQPVPTVHPRPADPSTARYVSSYLIMRTVVGLLGIALPFVLVLVDGVWFDSSPFLRESLSAYYYSGARELFVGGWTTRSARLPARRSSSWRCARPADRAI